MPLDPPPPEEAVRRAEAQSLDMEALRPTFDRLARLAQTITGAPIAQVALALDSQLWTTGVTDAPLPTRVDRATINGLRVSRGRPAWIADTAEDPSLRFVGQRIKSDGIQKFNATYDKNELVGYLN